MSRIFKIPRDTSGKWTLEIELVEPTLTGDNVGHKTWLSAYLLARHLPVMIEKLHPHPHPSVQSLIPNPSRPMRILELGSGTGLVGITAAALLPHAHVRLTDLPEVGPLPSFSTLFRMFLVQLLQKHGLYLGACPRAEILNPNFTTDCRQLRAQCPSQCSSIRPFQSSNGECT